MSCLILFVVAPVRGVLAADSNFTGEQIFKSKCARCHGPKGEGTSEYEQRLEGERTVPELTTLIAKTMPGDDPGTLTAQQAGKVAAYIHDAFYSAIARERNKPARIELTHLTVVQHRQALADLIGSFREPVERPGTSGLKAEYYNGRRIGRRSGRAAEQIDPQINFDFGKKAPLKEITEPYQFSIRWRGSLLAEETGEYEFVIHTEHAARLWINDGENPLIDAWVKSGNETEYKARLFLVGGRSYPLRMDFTKAKQGVDDSKKQKKKPESAPASVALLWKRPQSVLEPIPSRHFSPDSVAESFVCTTAFPPDDRSYGWVRGTAVSKAWDQATTNAALEAAGYIADNLDELADTRRSSSEERIGKLKTFCRSFSERAFRRPLGDDAVRRYVDKQFEVESNPKTAVKRVVLLALKSPRFLFREIGGEEDGYDAASRLSFGLWDSIPDRELLSAAADGRLETREQVNKQAERMMSDPRAERKLRRFLLTWLMADTDIELSKDEEKFPDFDNAVIADLKTSLELFLDDVVGSPQADYRRLLLAEDLFLNDRLASLYGVKSISGSEFSKVQPESGRRAGILTHPYLMARFAYNRETSPIHRGVFLLRGVLGRTLHPPPEAVSPLDADLHPEFTTRERVVLQTKSDNCMTCHGIINPLGFTLEQFDAVGRYREQERGKQVDVAGSYTTRSGKTVSFDGPRELAKFLAESEESHDAFIEQLFHHLVGQPLNAYGSATKTDLRRKFAKNDYNIRKLAVEIMAASALIGRETKFPVKSEIRK